MVENGPKQEQKQKSYFIPQTPNPNPNPKPKPKTQTLPSPPPLPCSFAWLAAFAVSPFGAAERCWKPFNPILGETFELEVGAGVRYLAEQVRVRGGPWPGGGVVGGGTSVI